MLSGMVFSLLLERYLWEKMSTKRSKIVRGEREEIQPLKLGQAADVLGDGLQLVVGEGPVEKVERESQRIK